jgi:methionyl-tRNA formyltransferase
MPAKIVFFGTGPVSLATLEGIKDHFVIEAVITKPDSSSSSGRQIAPPVKIWADDNKVPVYQPATKAELVALISDQKFESRLGLVVDYGLIIPESVINAFPLGIANSHFSLLPEWRGADPITFAILSGQEETGVSLMLIVAALDEGPLLARKHYKIAPNMTTPELTDALVSLSNKLIQVKLPEYINGSLKPYNQQHPERISYSKMLHKSDGLIDWAKPAEQIEREIRAYLGWPGSQATIGGKDVTITGAHIAPLSGMPGQASKQDKELVVYCGQNALVIDKLKPAGKREMTGPEFLAGNAI